MATDLVGEAIYVRLSSDHELSALLARDVNDPTRPAIYTVIPVPLGAELPYVVAYAANVSAEDDDVLDAHYERLGRDIHAYDAHPDDDGGGSAALVNAIAARIHELFHRQTLHIQGTIRNLSCSATPPIANDGETAFGRVIGLELQNAATVTIA